MDEPLCSTRFYNSFPSECRANQSPTTTRHRWCRTELQVDLGHLKMRVFDTVETPH